VVVVEGNDVRGVDALNRCWFHLKW
jgi:hypothetical protein